MSRRLVVCSLFLLMSLAVAAPAPAHASREIPVGLWGVENNPIRTGRDQLAIRFVLDQPTTMYRFISGFNLEGVYTDEAGRPAPADMRTAYRDKRRAPDDDGGDSRWPAPPAGLPGDWRPGSGRIGYAHGDGGVIRARLVTVKPNGEPDLSHVLGEESVNAVRRYKESKQAYGAPGRNQLLHFNLGGARLAAETMYAVVFSNASRDPYSNYFSTNLPATRQSVAGPNGRNNLDPNAPGAVAGLDAREAVTWSSNGGSNWVWGWRVGGGNLFGYYAASPTGDGGPRMPWYGWQEGPRAAPRSNQPYFAYAEAGSYTLVARRAPKAVTLTEAGGYAPKGAQVGVVTVRNITTGQTARTGSLGGGLAKGRLTHPVKVAAGQSYEISNSGTVLKAEGDSFIRSTFRVGEGDWPFTTKGHGEDRAELYALPHPWFGPRPRRAAAAVVLKARALRRARLARTGGRKVSLRVRGRVSRPHLAGRARVRIQARVRGRWRHVARIRMGRGGRFARRLPFRVARGRRVVTVRALAGRAGRSRGVRVRVR